MKPSLADNKYKAGESVFTKKNPTQKLIIRRYIDRIYYCKAEEDPNQKEVAYFERELI